MSEQVNHEDVKTVSTDGVTVERELVCTDAGIEGTFILESRRADPVVVRVVDELPEYFPIDDVAFEPDATPEAGEITPDGVTVTQTVGDEPERIRYGIVPSEPVAEVRWSAPTVERVDPLESVADGETDGPVGPVAHLAGLFGTEPDDSPSEGSDASEKSGEGDASEKSGEGDAGDGDDGEGPADATTRIEPRTETGGTPVESSDAEDATDETADVSDDTSDAESGDDAPSDGERGEETDGDVEPSEDIRLAETDGESGDEPVARHFEVRLDRLTARVEKFGAYASALEPLIDEHGTGESALAGIEDDLSDLDRRLGSVREDVESARQDRERSVANLQDSIGDIDGALDEVEAAVETLETEVDGLDLGLDAAEEDIDDLQGRVDDHDEAIESTRADVGDLESDLTEVDEGVSTVEDDLATLEERVDGFESELDDLTETVESVEAELSTLSESVESIHDELADINEEVETLHEFRKSLAQISNIEE